MKTYNVKNIAAITGTNEETVRRWIRSGKLKSKGVSTIDGNIIAESDLIQFLKKTPKYLSAVTQKVSKSIKENPVEASIYISAGVIGGGLAILLASLLDKAISPEEQKAANESIKNDIIQTESSIKEKEEMIRKIQRELEEEKEYLEQLSSQIKEEKDEK